MEFVYLGQIAAQDPLESVDMTSSFLGCVVGLMPFVQWPNGSLGVANICDHLALSTEVLGTLVSEGVGVQGCMIFMDFGTFLGLHRSTLPGVVHGPCMHPPSNIYRRKFRFNLLSRVGGEAWGNG